MKLSPYVIFGFLLCFTLAMTSCSSTKSGAKPANPTGTSDANTVTMGNASNLTLVDYLRKVPGLRITGRGSSATVMVRGAGSIGGNNEPLFVLDGSPLGNSFSQVASSIDVNDIAKVKVLKDTASTSSYGVQGSAGVIEITTKKSNK